MIHGLISGCLSCKAPVTWVMMASGKLMPIDPEPVADGNVVLGEWDEALSVTHARVLKKGEKHAGAKFMSHFATCANAAQHRRR